MILSDKYWDYIDEPARAEFLEGTTSSGKTTTVGIKFMMNVYESEKRLHVIASKTIGVAEKNIIHSDMGLKKIFPEAEYCGNGDKDNKLAHIKLLTATGTKIIYVLGYDNSDKWENVLGSQFGCVWVDECNTADINFIHEIFGRCDYFVGTLNPDSPTLPVYDEYINRSRPVPKYEKDVPDEIMRDLNRCSPVAGWKYWFFTFKDNVSMTEEKIAEKIASYPPGTKIHKNKVLGLRGKSTGLVFLVFDRRKHCIGDTQAKSMNFMTFTAGLDTAYSSRSPDTIAMSFGGITTDRKFVLLAEEVYNNAELNTPLAPSDTVARYVDFLNRSKAKWGFARQTFIDSADQATITEFHKYRRNHPECLYLFNPAFKKVQIIDRIEFQNGWFSEGSYLIHESCRNYINELETYSWQEDKDNTPEDGNDHMINSVQYAWIPYRDKIGAVR